MNNLTKAQKERLLMIVVGTIALMAAVWFFMVQPKQAELARTQRDINDKQGKLDTAQKVLVSAPEVGTTFTNKFSLLQQREGGLAPERGAYEWIINTVNPFIQSRKGVNIVNFSEPVISDQGLVPKFPYRWATFKVTAVGFYQDFGHFLADFENAFPYFRIQNVVVSGNTGPATEQEQLAFTFDIVTPVISASDSK